MCPKTSKSNPRWECALKGTHSNGMLLQPTHELTIDCFVDVDFAGQWNVKDPHDPLCVKS